jgi:predicted ATPase
MEVELARGQLPVAELERLVAEHPLRERLRGHLMTALYRGGRQAEALAAYRQGREALMDQLGLEPCPALRRLETEILRHELPVTTAPRGVPLARPLVEARRVRIVGRHAELERARVALATAQPCAVLVEAEAGMGKTRLLAELAHEAHGAGRTVLYGRAEACSPIPYQPFVDALRHHVAHDAAFETAGLERELAAVADVMPELRERFPPFAGHVPDWRLFAGLAALVAQLGRTRPLLLVLDDLHHARPSTLRLLRHLLCAGTPLTVLGASRNETLREAVAGHGRLEQIHLAGLSATAARELAGTQELWELTGGNPLLLGELLRERALPRLRQRVPERVQLLLEARLARIDDPHGALAAAAIAGPEFSLELVEAALRAPAGAVLDVIEQAMAARIVVELRAGRFRFTPPLVREALRERVSETRRARLERRLAELGREVPRAA